MNLELLKMLADNGQPLNLSAREEDEKLMISRDGGPPLPSRWFPGALELLRKSLTHYPREVWINGESAETSPPPQTAMAWVQTPQGPCISRIQDEMLRDTGSEVLPRSFNTIAGGVCCETVFQTGEEEERQSIYLSPVPESGNGNHRLLSAIRLKPHTEILTEELVQLQHERNRIQIPRGSALEHRTSIRRRLICENTKAQPDMPEEFIGTVFFYPLTSWDGELIRAAPMQVLGQPVVIPDEGPEDNGQFVTAVETLISGDSGMMPAREGGGQVQGQWFPGPGPEVTRLHEIRFTQEPEETQNPERITMTGRLSDGTPLSLPARFCLSGDEELFAECSVIPGQIPQQDLTDILMRAYWTDEDHQDWDRRLHSYQEMTGRMTNLATHLLGDNPGAYREEMQRALEQFHTQIPQPGEQVTVTSSNGRMTMTFNPE